MRGFVCVNTRIPTGINSETIIIGENNVESWENPEMKGAWGMHILTTDSHNNIQRDRICFVLCKSGSTTTTLTSLVYEKPIKSPRTQIKTELDQLKNIRNLGCNGSEIHLSFSFLLEHKVQFLKTVSRPKNLNSRSTNQLSTAYQSLYHWMELALLSGRCLTCYQVMTE